MCALAKQTAGALLVLCAPVRAALSAIGGWNERGLREIVSVYNVLPFVRYNVSVPASPNSHAEAGVLPA